MPIVGVYIIDKNNKSSRLSWKGPGRDHSVVRVNTVHPYDGPAHGNLGVDCAAVLVTLKDSRFKTERAHQKALSGLEILVHP
ncbi:MAG TPA: hypothetical protein VGR53_09460 [Nitrososphaerales archaeon]|nr:hypothetical protein [Nitrososphaerales archaeon]